MANVSRFDPFNDLVDDLFKGFLVRPMYTEGREAIAKVKVDVSERNGAYLVTAELPGVRKELSGRPPPVMCAIAAMRSSCSKGHSGFR